MSTPRPQVLYVTYDGLLEPLGASQVLPYVRGLRDRGLAFEILSFEKPADLARTDAVASLSAELAAGGMSWTPLRYHKRPSLPATARDVLAGRRFVGRWMRGRHGRPSLVHARGYLPALMGLAGQVRGARLLFDMRGLWVDERIEAGYWRPRSVAAALGRRAERVLLRRADHLVVVSRRGTRHLPRLAGGGTLPPWTVIPPRVDLRRFRPPTPSERASARRELNLGEGPVLIHTGALGGWYEGERTMEVARRFLDLTGGAFVVLTRDPDHARALARAAGVTAGIHTALPAEVPRWLQACDAGIALVRVTPSKEASFPVKVSEYLASGLAVLATPVGDLEDLEDPAVLRLLRPGEDPGPAAAWLGRPASPERAGEARAVAERHLALDGGVDALEEIYATLGVRAEAVG